MSVPLAAGRHETSFWETTGRTSVFGTREIQKNSKENRGKSMKEHGKDRGST